MGRYTGAGRFGRLAPTPGPGYESGTTDRATGSKPVPKEEVLRNE